MNDAAPQSAVHGETEDDEAVTTVLKTVMTTQAE